MEEELLLAEQLLLEVMVLRQRQNHLDIVPPPTSCENVDYEKREELKRLPDNVKSKKREGKERKDKLSALWMSLPEDPTEEHQIHLPTPTI
jgi:hypothetical protein